ncbi:MAG: DNA polymerase Y family protein, partial [Polaromonas sp.]|nr:DNA polymerase Y family protein [Polaromonas sp.]
LDQARGAVPDAYDWLVLPEQFEETLELDDLVTHGPALMAGIERLLPSLQAWLLGRQRGLCALELTWHMDPRRDVAPTGCQVVRTDQPAQDLRHIIRLVAEHLAQQTLAAPVHSLTLKSLVTEPLVNAAAATPSLLIEDRQTGGSAMALVERLSARLGDTRVCVWQPCADHRPEQMQQWVPAKSASQFIAKNAVKTRAKHTNDSKNSATQPPGVVSDALYPSWLLSEPLALRSVGNSPVYQGRLQRLAGPQRLESCGWLMNREGLTQPLAQRARPPAIRDYFIYRSEQAGLLWIYSERLATGEVHVAMGGAPPQRAWFLHGFFA